MEPWGIEKFSQTIAKKLKLLTRLSVNVGMLVFAGR
jgi:hypothetical protein